MEIGARRIVLMVMVVVFAATIPVYSYQISPLSVVYESSGPGAAKIYTVTNDSDSPIAIYFKPYKRYMDENGKEYMEDASAFFLIQPQKMIIKPQSSQLVRVQYRGPKVLTKEASFRIVSEQIPYSLGAGGNQDQMISFLFVFSTAAYVQPTKIVESVSVKASLGNDDRLDIWIENTGSVHQILNGLDICITGNDGSVYHLKDEEKDFASGLNLLSGAKVKLSLDVPTELSGASDFVCGIDYDFDY